jgi:hypothetical protein
VSTMIGVGLLVLGMLLTAGCVLLIVAGDPPTRLLGVVTVLAVAPMTCLLARELWRGYQP